MIMGATQATIPGGSTGFWTGAPEAFPHPHHRKIQALGQGNLISFSHQVAVAGIKWLAGKGRHHRRFEKSGREDLVFANP
jgi:hypothetical protein